MDTTRRPTLVKVEDHEGDGICQLCSRSGLRWLVALSDGSRLGLECAKKTMGWNLTRNDYTWVPDYRAVAEQEADEQIYVLWEHRTIPGRTCITRNGRQLRVSDGYYQWRVLGLRRLHP
jgi:hypothetical protein